LAGPVAISSSLNQAVKIGGSGEVSPGIVKNFNLITIAFNRNSFVTVVGQITISVSKVLNLNTYTREILQD
jgi:hypothetical protein